MQTPTPETQESYSREAKLFDPAASVRMMRFDLDNFGQIDTETYRRVYDEELTFVAEGINLPFRTEFELKEIDGELSYFKEGEWQPYISMLEIGLQTAQAEAEQDPRKQFLVEMAQGDLAVGHKFNQIQPGESLEWYSAYPYDEEAEHGEEFLEDIGLQPKRKMGFLYRAHRDQQGKMFLESHSVDNSDEDAFRAAMAATIYEEEADMETMIQAYDGVLSDKMGGEYRAGRKVGQETEDNAWDVIAANKNLNQWYFDQIESLARSELEEAATEERKQELTLQFWAAIKVRIDKEAYSADVDFQTLDMNIDPRRIAAETEAAYKIMQVKGEKLIGCGGGMSLDLKALSPTAARDLIFGGGFDLMEEADKYGSLKFKCPNGHENKRPKDQLLEECQTCGCSVKC